MSVSAPTAAVPGVVASFCFPQQALKSNEHVRGTVLSFVDPRLTTDRDTHSIDKITLSEAFYPVETRSRGR